MGTWFDTRTALLAVLEALADEFPPTHKHREADRSLMQSYIERHDYPGARMAAIWSGIPPERIEAVEALLL